MSVSYNDFVIRFANVNGSGSASANGMFAKALFRMGIPVATRNIFPSNIQGLPTWFEVRVSEKGYLGRREGVDIMVAMNAETFVEDVASVSPGVIWFTTAPSLWPSIYSAMTSSRLASLSRPCSYQSTAIPSSAACLKTSPI